MDQTTFVYKRINHFHELMEQFKSNDPVPQNVIDIILHDLRKQRYTDMSNVHNMTVKRILKQNGLNRYYEYIVRILDQIKTRDPIDLNQKVTVGCSDSQMEDGDFQKYLKAFDGKTIYDLLSDFLGKYLMHSIKG